MQGSYSGCVQHPGYYGETPRCCVPRGSRIVALPGSINAGGPNRAEPSLASEHQLNRGELMVRAPEVQGVDSQARAEVERPWVEARPERDDTSSEPGSRVTESVIMPEIMGSRLGRFGYRPASLTS